MKPALLLLILLVSGCTSEGAKNISGSAGGGEVKEVTVGRCRYVVLIGYEKGAICHAGYCQHKEIQ